MASGPSRTLKLRYVGDASGLTKANRDAGRSIDTFGSKVADFGKKVGAAATVASAALTALAVKVGIDAVNAASDLNEELAKAGELFGDQVGEINAWASTAATAFGQSQRAALQAAGNFAIFGAAAGLAGDDLTDFATGFTELASDLASFNNTTPEEAVLALGAALRGESEPIRRYGILINEAALRQAALELGIVKTTKEALTPQQRVLAAQKVIYDQVGAAAGDFERTSDGLANTQRILTAQIEDGKAAIGEALLPVINDLVGIISRNLPTLIDWGREFAERLAPGLRDAADFGKRVVSDFGVWWDANGDNVKTAFQNVADSVGNVVSKFRDFVNAARDEVKASGSIGRLVQAAKDLGAGLDDTRIAFDKLIASFGGEQVERTGRTFGRIFELQYLKPIEYFLGLITEALDAVDDLFELLADYNKLREEIVNAPPPDLSRPPGTPDVPQGGTFSVPLPPNVTQNPPVGTPPSQRLPGRPPSGGGSGGNVRQSSIYIQTGIGDPEKIAREVERVLAGSARRSGGGGTATFL